MAPGKSAKKQQAASTHQPGYIRRKYPAEPVTRAIFVSLIRPVTARWSVHYWCDKAPVGLKCSFDTRALSDTADSILSLLQSAEMIAIGSSTVLRAWFLSISYIWIAYRCRWIFGLTAWLAAGGSSALECHWQSPRRWLHIGGCVIMWFDD